MKSSSLGFRARRKHPGVRVRDYARQEQRDDISALAKERKGFRPLVKNKTQVPRLALGKGKESSLQTYLSGQKESR
jgi:hypothetical protein